MQTALYTDISKDFFFYQPKKGKNQLRGPVHACPEITHVGSIVNKYA